MPTFAILICFLWCAGIVLSKRFNFSPSLGPVFSCSPSQSAVSQVTLQRQLAQAYLLSLQQTKGKNTMPVMMLNSKSPTYSHWLNFVSQPSPHLITLVLAVESAHLPGMGHRRRLYGPRGRRPVFQERAQADFTRLWLEYSSRREGNRSRTLNIMVTKMIKFEEEAKGE